MSCKTTEVEGFCVAFFKKRPRFHRRAAVVDLRRGRNTPRFKSATRGEFAKLSFAKRGTHKWGFPYNK